MLRELVMKIVTSKSGCFLILVLVAFMYNASNVFAAVVPKTEPIKIAEVKVSEVSPVEDLMREHGVLSRLLLIYDACLKRMDSGNAVPTAELAQATELIRDFIQNYHEKLEEQYVFPKFAHDSKLQALTTTLIQQHEAGRKLIAEIFPRLKLQTSADRKIVATAMRAFIKMYRPHKGREDTILFPALHAVVSNQEYEKMGDIFEDKEQQLFGENGFETIVGRVEAIEKSLDIYNLSQFTPAT